MHKELFYNTSLVLLSLLSPAEDSAQVMAPKVSEQLLPMLPFKINKQACPFQLNLSARQSHVFSSLAFYRGKLHAEA